jgi:hypothetical protein
MKSGLDGSLIPMAKQDRSQRDRSATEEGIALVTAALPRGPIGPHQLQAATAALHDEAQSHEATGWPQIAALYDVLLRLDDNPVAGPATPSPSAWSPDRLLAEDARPQPEPVGKPVERGLDIAVGETGVDIHGRLLLLLIRRVPAGHAAVQVGRWTATGPMKPEPPRLPGGHGRRHRRRAMRGPFDPIRGGKRWPTTRLPARSSGYLPAHSLRPV